MRLRGKLSHKWSEQEKTIPSKSVNQLLKFELTNSSVLPIVSEKVQTA